jgi:hypothetical protein
MPDKLPKHIRNELIHMEAHQDFERAMSIQRKYDRYRTKGMSKKEAEQKVADWEEEKMDEDIADLIEAEKDLLERGERRKSKKDKN